MANKRIESLYVDGVGPFSDFIINFPLKQIENEAEVHIFTGENGVGKSTLLYCLTAFINEKDFIFPRIDNLLGKIKIEINVDNQTQVSTFKFRMIGENDQTIAPVFSNFLSLTNHVGNLPNNQIDFGMFAYSSYRKFESKDVKSFEEANSNPLNNALSFSTNHDSKKILKWIASLKEKELDAIKENNFEIAVRSASNISKITYLFYEISGLKINFEWINNPIINILMRIEGEIVNFDTLPDGLKSIISWIADLLMRMDRIPWVNNEDVFDRNFILFLDEIEVHLHPAWQRKILPVVKKLFKNAQIFISTHSPFVIGSVDGAWIYKLKREGQKSVLNGEPVLSEDAKSYRLILQEIFGIEDDFGPDVVKDLDKFYSLKKQILKGELSLDDHEFQAFADSLAVQSTELQTIIGMELRQLSRIKGQTA